MRIVDLWVSVHNVTAGLNYGIFKVKTIQLKNKDERLFYSKNNFDGSMEVRNYPETCKVVGIKHPPTLFCSSVSAFPEPPYQQLDNKKYAGITDNQYEYNFGAAGQSITYEIKINTPGMEGLFRVITSANDTQYHTYSISISFVKNGSSLWTSTWIMESGYGTQFGLYHLSIACAMLPMITEEGDAVSLSNYTCWVQDRLIVGETLGMRATTIESLAYTSNNIVEAWNEAFGDYNPEEFDDGNPYADGGESTEDEGNANFSDNSDSVILDDLPTLDAISSGFATLFTPSKTQLRALANVMWGADFVSFLQNMVENIKDMFTSLAIVPFEVTAGRTVEVTWFGLAITNVNLTLCAQQYYEFNMGTINMSNDSRIFTSGSALDYSPYSRLGIFLPFIGYQELDIDECRNGAINLKYRIDVLSGSCVATISVDGNAIYQFSGNCLTQIPISSNSMESLVSDAVNVGIAAAETHAAKGAVSSAGDALGEARQAESGVKGAETQLAHANAKLASAKGQLASATANAAMGMKPSFAHAGSVSAAAALLSIRQPYLFLTTPRQSMPKYYQRYCGFPSNITGKLSDFSGFTVVESIRLNDLVATTPEIAEIYELLKEGVII